jgi:pSer/pThr/pTyr-binding forkhead associated (FHA) protein
VERVVFVEVLDRRGRVVERTKIDAFPATIGRAYSNDVIIADRYASPTHVAIRASDDGVLLIEDVGSVNGVHRLGDDEPVAAAPLESGLRLRLGETVIRFVTADHLVAPADILLRDRWGLLEVLKNSRIALAVPWVTLGVIVTDIYLETYYDFSGSTVVAPALLGMVALSVWAGIWAFVNRVMTHRFDYPRHLALVCLVTIASVCLWPLSEYIEFFFLSDSLAMGAAYVTQASLVAFLLYGHLSIIPTSSRPRRRGWALGVTFVMVGIVGLLTFAQRRDFSSTVDVHVPLKSLGAEWAPAVTMEDFLTRSRRTKAWVDEAARE